jgi:adenylosuccinate lyase
MGAIWSERATYDAWLEVELAATDALAAAGVVPGATRATLRASARFDIARIEENRADDAARRDRVHDGGGRDGRAGARWLHFGLTSSDVLDTALALQMRSAAI